MPKTSASPPPATVPVETPLPALPPALARLGRALVYLAIALGPLLTLPPNVGLVGSLETPRRLALLLCGGVLLALLLYAWARRGRVIWRAHPLDLPVALFTLAALISSLASAYPFISLWGPLWSQDGLLFVLTGVLLYLGVKEFLRTPEDIGRAFTLLVVIGGIAAVLGIGDFILARSIGGYAGYNAFFAGKRLMGSLGNPMFAGTYFLLIIPLAAVQALQARTARQRALLVAVLLLALLALLLTQSRAAWVALALSLPVFLLMVGQLPGDHRAITRAVWSVVLLGAVLVGGVIIAVPAVRARVATMVNMEDETVMTRSVYMRGAYNVFAQRPAQGWGVGAVRTVFPQYRPFTQARENAMALNRAYATAQPHNLLLQIAAEMGLLGLLAFALLIIMAVRVVLPALGGDPATRGIAIGVGSMLLAYLLVNQLAFDNAATQSLFWIGLGLLAALTARDGAPAVLARPFTPGAARGVAIGALVIGAGTLLHVLFEVVAASLTLQAMQHSALAKATVYKNPAVAYREFRAAEDCLARSRFFTVAPDLRGVVWYGDVKTYEVWADICYNELQMLQPDPETFGQMDKSYEQRYLLAQGHFKDSAQRGLRMIDRDYYILRFQVNKYLLDAEISQRFNDEEGLRIAKADFEAVWTKLHDFEPNSAEVDLTYSSLQKVLGNAAYDRLNLAIRQANLFDAKLAKTSGAAAQALQAQLAALQDTMTVERNAALSYYSEAQAYADIATRKDGTFPEAFAQLAYVQYRQTELFSPDTQALINNICDNYARAEQLKLTLSQDDLFAYAKTLFLYGLDPIYRVEQISTVDTITSAIEHAKELEPAQRAALITRVSMYYRLYRRAPAELQAVLTELNIPAPKPPSPSPLPKPAPAFPGA